MPDNTAAPTSTSMTDEQLQEIESRVAAVSGEWELVCIASGSPETVEFEDGGAHTYEPQYFKHVNGQQVFADAWKVRGLETLGDHECDAMELPQAEFVFYARTDIRALLAEIRRLLAALSNERMVWATAVSTVLERPEHIDLIGSSPDDRVRVALRPVADLRADNARLRDLIRGIGHQPGCRLQTEEHCANCKRPKSGHDSKWLNGHCPDGRGRPLTTSWSALPPHPCNCIQSQVNT